MRSLWSSGSMSGLWSEHACRIMQDRWRRKRCGNVCKVALLDMQIIASTGHQKVSSKIKYSSLPDLFFLMLSRNSAYSNLYAKPLSSQQLHQATQSQRSSRLAGRPFSRTTYTANHVRLRVQRPPGRLFGTG